MKRIVFANSKPIEGKIMNKRKSMRYPIKGIVMVASIIIAGHLAAMALNGEPLVITWFKDYNGLKILCAIFFPAAFVYLMFYFYSKLQSSFGIKTLSQYKSSGNKVLLIPMSPPSKNIKAQTASYSFPLTLIDGTGKEVTLCGDDLSADIKVLNNIERWNWQHFMRSLVPHKYSNGDTLEYVCLFGSKKTSSNDGSFPHLDNARIIIKQYFPEAKVELYKREIDFDNFDELYKCMKETVEGILKGGYRENEISIDTTGGIKTASIVGATITFNKKISFQYVDTNPPFDCYTYDVVHHQPAWFG
jgi:hypothetical protein